MWQRRRRACTGVISGALPYIESDLLSHLRHDPGRWAAGCAACTPQSMQQTQGNSGLTADARDLAWDAASPGTKPETGMAAVALSAYSHPCARWRRLARTEGLIVSAAIVGALAGSVSGGHLSDRQGNQDWPASLADQLPAHGQKPPGFRPGATWCRLGRKRALQLADVLFLTGALCMALAPSAAALIAGGQPSTAQHTARSAWPWHRLWQDCRTCTSHAVQHSAARRSASCALHGPDDLCGWSHYTGAAARWTLKPQASALLAAC